MPFVAAIENVRMLRVDLLVLPNAASSTLLGMFDVLSSVGRDWELITGSNVGGPRVRPRLVSPTGGAVEVLNGVGLRTHVGFAEARDPDLVLVPDLMVDPAGSLTGQFPEAVDWLRERFAAGALIATVCSGSLLLAETGLLAGCDATTHWVFSNMFARDYPDVKLHPNRVLVATGEGERLITAGGASSWHDLLLYLIARFIGPEQAIHIAKLYLLQIHAEGQLPYACITANSQHDDKVIRELQHWLALNYHSSNPVTTMMQRSGLSERTFKRRFKFATGLAPIDYVHNLRIEEAKQMLEAESAPVEAIALEVGYDDATFFRRLFKRKTGLTAIAYRRKFQTISRLRPRESAGASQARPF